MKKLLIALLFLPALFVVPSCGGGEETPVEDSSAMLMPNHAWLNLSKYGMEVSIQVPDSTVGLMEVVHTNSGAVEITVGKNFGIAVLFGEGDIALLKEDLTSDAVFKSEILIDEQGTLMYSRSIPDTEIETQHHFFYTANINNAIYEVKTLEMETYGKKVVEDMLKAAKTLKANVVSQPV
ncbi:MAG: hypothetical protein QY303_11670 [Vicingaceae bacterium]|nr:MAG: hypothetical protein QY303_11670 [Vicingaceae bacterium]